jgi:hypothetical protein
VRYSCRRSGDCHSVKANQEDQWPATIYDISSEGLSLVVCHPFGVGEFLAVELDDATEGTRSKLFVRVKHSTSQGDGVWTLGCRLVNRLNHGELEQLR